MSPHSHVRKYPLDIRRVLNNFLIGLLEHLSSVGLCLSWVLLRRLNLIQRIDEITHEQSLRKEEHKQIPDVVNGLVESSNFLETLKYCISHSAIVNFCAVQFENYCGDFMRVGGSVLKLTKLQVINMSKLIRYFIPIREIIVKLLSFGR